MDRPVCPWVDSTYAAPLARAYPPFALPGVRLPPKPPCRNCTILPFHADRGGSQIRNGVSPFSIPRTSRCLAGISTHRWIWMAIVPGCCADIAVASERTNSRTVPTKQHDAPTDLKTPLLLQHDWTDTRVAVADKSRIEPHAASRSPCARAF